MTKHDADELYELAVAEHAKAYDAAKLIADPELRQEAFRKADEAYELQREHQRKVRCGK